MLFIDVLMGSPSMSLGKSIITTRVCFARVSRSSSVRYFHLTGEVVTSIQLAKYDKEGHPREIFLMCLRYGIKSLDEVSNLEA